MKFYKLNLISTSKKWVEELKRKRNQFPLCFRQIKCKYNKHHLSCFIIYFHTYIARNNWITIKKTHQTTCIEFIQLKYVIYFIQFLYKNSFIDSMIRRSRFNSDFNVHSSFGLNSTPTGSEIDSMEIFKLIHHLLDIAMKGS